MRDIASHIKGIGRVGLFTPGPNTPAPYNAPTIGLVDGTNVGTSSRNKAEIYNRLLLEYYAGSYLFNTGLQPEYWAQRAFGMYAKISDLTNRINAAESILSGLLAGVGISTGPTVSMTLNGEASGYVFNTAQTTDGWGPPLTWVFSATGLPANTPVQITFTFTGADTFTYQPVVSSVVNNGLSDATGNWTMTTSEWGAVHTNGTTGTVSHTYTLTWLDNGNIKSKVCGSYIFNIAAAGTVGQSYNPTAVMTANGKALGSSQTIYQTSDGWTAPIDWYLGVTGLPPNIPVQLVFSFSGADSFSYYPGVSATTNNGLSSAAGTFSMTNFGWSAIHSNGVTGTVVHKYGLLYLYQGVQRYIDIGSFTFNVQPISGSTVTTTIANRNFQPGQNLLTMNIYGTQVKYQMDRFSNVNGSIPIGNEFWQLYHESFNLDLFLQNYSGRHVAIMLGDNGALRNPWTGLFPAGEGAPSLGQGLIIGDLAQTAEMNAVYGTTGVGKCYAVPELFDKGSGDQLLFPAYATVVPTGGTLDIQVLRHVNIATNVVKLRYVLKGQNGFFYDSQWFTMPHSQPLNGPDFSRSCFPQGATAVGTACYLIWSTTALTPS